MSVSPSVFLSFGFFWYFSKSFPLFSPYLHILHVCTEDPEFRNPPFRHTLDHKDKSHYDYGDNEKAGNGRRVAGWREVPMKYIGWLGPRSASRVGVKREVITREIRACQIYRGNTHHWRDGNGNEAQRQLVHGPLLASEREYVLYTCQLPVRIYAKKTR